MPTPDDFTSCANCGKILDTSADTFDSRAPCPNCRETRRVVSAHIIESVTVRDGVAVKGFRAGETKAFVEDKGMPSYSYTLGKLVFHERVIDRENNRYFERVTDYETGGVIHIHEEPLSEHRGHGSAKQTSKPENNDG